MNAPAPAFRPASRDDIGAVLELLDGAHLPTDGVTEMFARDASQFLLATHATNPAHVLGVGAIEVCCNSALLRSVAVRDNWQRNGLGYLLVKRLVCEAESRGIQALYLLTMTAEHYFPRFGFETIARDTVPPEIAATLEFTSACPASAVVMAKTLAAIEH